VLEGNDTIRVQLQALGAGSVIMWIGMSKGCLPVKVQQFDNDGTRYHEGLVEISKIMSDDGAECFYPMSMTSRVGLGDQWLMTVVAGTLKLNRQIPEDRFNMVARANESVVDTNAHATSRPSQGSTP
jgi:hypothetical protein